MAWMRMMGVDSVAYHEHTVVGRGDDPVARAADYYASRGETPMVWGGRGRLELGLDGEVDLADWRAIFGPGGASDPLTGERLLCCRRPGMELVVSPHKSVAELGVIGRVEDMHAIVDAERDATLGYLDELFIAAGGRRGRAATRTATGGLIWASSRHATTRAGDPQVHDHVLIANVVSMRDARGGWKALDTAFLRDHLHAATAVGRMAAAAKAVELGYGIEADSGRSGKLGGWAIAGIPHKAQEIHSTRSAQIDAAVGPDASYASRQVAARATRDHKTDESIEDLVGRWRHELSEAGYPPHELASQVVEAGLNYERPAVPEWDRIAELLLSAGGALAERKTFDRHDVIVAVAPLLHGHPVSILDHGVEQILGHHLAVPLPSVGAARGEVWSAASVISDEERIAKLAEALLTRRSDPLPAEAAARAVSVLEAERGVTLTQAQRDVAEGILSSGHGLDVVVGVAGSGKTTTLAAVAAGYETAGYTVVGAATSGQAARTLETGAGMESRTVASLSWRLDHGRLHLTDRHVLILDEAGMTTDADVGRLLAAVEAAGAKMIVVGDYRQLDAIGPGGALEALSARHPEVVWTLDANLRQQDLGERQALEELRAGNLKRTVAWYGNAGRVHAAPGRNAAAQNMIAGWAHDIAAGKDSVLLAYRRASVDILNQAARQAWQRAGFLHGPELRTGDGRVFQAGDRIITLTPGPDRAWTTSQRATVSSVDPAGQWLVARTPEGQDIRLGADCLGADQVAYGYAMTAHRSQGATVDTAHVLADGGGRELAYVAMSRARTDSHIHIISPNPREALQRLVLGWQTEKRQAWNLQPEPRRSVADLYAERAELVNSIPESREHQLRHDRNSQAQLMDERRELLAGQGRWANHPAGYAYRDLAEASARHDQARQRAEDADLRWWNRRSANKELDTATAALDNARQTWQGITGLHLARIDARAQHLASQISQHEQAEQQRKAFLEQHPDIPGRLAELSTAIKQAHELERQQRLERLQGTWLGDDRHVGPDHSRGPEPDTGLSL